MSGLTEASPVVMMHSQSRRTRIAKVHRFETIELTTRNLAQLGFLTPISSTL